MNPIPPSPTRPTWRPAALLAPAFLLPLFASAQDSPPPQPPATTEIPRVAGDFTVDGRADEAAWSQAAEIALAYELQPGDNLPAKVATTARVLHTEDALLLHFRAEDPDPSQIRAFLRDRDALYSDDFLGVLLDTFDDQRRAYEFFVNPLGVQADMIKEEATGNEDDSWDGLWTSAAHITDRGYEVEMRIPFATLRFADTDGLRRWGLRLMRVRPREHRYLYADVRMERGARCDLCATRKVEGFAGVRQGRNLEITPTLTLRHAQTRSAGGWRSADGTEIEPGLDVTWAPTPNLTLNGTLNPDFSQVESDEAQLDLNTSFALFFPEKRPFFLEGADYFNTPLNVIYTRQLADPDIGLRVTGRSGRQAYGVVVGRDATTQILAPDPNALGSGFRFLDQDADALFGRYRLDLDTSTSLGAVLTHRSGDDYRNTVAGIDGRWQRGAHTVTAQWLRSDSRYPDLPDPRNPARRLFPDVDPVGDAMLARYGFGNRHWNLNLSYNRIDPGFRADLGFINQIGYEKPVIGGGYTWYGKEGAKINRISYYADWDITHRHDGQLLERELEGYVRVNGPRQSEVSLAGLTRERFWDGALFNERWLSLFSQMTFQTGIRGSLYLRRGQQLDLGAARTGTIEEWEPSVNLDIGRGFNLNLLYSRQRLLRDGGTAFEAAVLDGRASWQFDPRQRLRLSVQASEVERDPRLYTRPVERRSRDIAAQLLYAYKLNPRSALYLGYSHAGYADDLQTSLTDSGRNLFMKLSYAWQP